MQIHIYKIPTKYVKECRWQKFFKYCWRIEANLEKAQILHECIKVSIMQNRENTEGHARWKDDDTATDEVAVYEWRHWRSVIVQVKGLEVVFLRQKLVWNPRYGILSSFFPLDTLHCNCKTNWKQEYCVMILRIKKSCTSIEGI